MIDLPNRLRDWADKNDVIPNTKTAALLRVAADALDEALKAGIEMTRTNNSFASRVGKLAGVMQEIGAIIGALPGENITESVRQLTAEIARLRQIEERAKGAAREWSEGAGDCPPEIAHGIGIARYILNGKAVAD